MIAYHPGVIFFLCCYWRKSQIFWQSFNFKRNCLQIFKNKHKISITDRFSVQFIIWNDRIHYSSQFQPNDIAFILQIFVEFSFNFRSIFIWFSFNFHLFCLSIFTPSIFLSTFNSTFPVNPQKLLHVNKFSYWKQLSHHNQHPLAP